MLIKPLEGQRSSEPSSTEGSIEDAQHRSRLKNIDQDSKTLDLILSTVCPCLQYPAKEHNCVLRAFELLGIHTMNTWFHSWQNTELPLMHRMLRTFTSSIWTNQSVRAANPDILLNCTVSSHDSVRYCIVA